MPEPIVLAWAFPVVQPGQTLIWLPSTPGTTPQISADNDSLKTDSTLITADAA